MTTIRSLAPAAGMVMCCLVCGCHHPEATRPTTCRRDNNCIPRPRNTTWLAKPRTTTIAKYDLAGYPLEFLEASAKKGDSEAACYIVWKYCDAGNFKKAAQWLNMHPTVNAAGVASALLVGGRIAPRDVEQVVAFCEAGAECPDVGGNEECAVNLADMFEHGRILPCDYGKAYYFLGICVAKCSAASENPADRSRFVTRQRRIASTLLPAERRRQDDRLRNWLDKIKSGGWFGMGELDSETPCVSVYPDPEGGDTATCAAVHGEKCADVDEVPITDLGGSLRRKGIPNTATIRIYSYEPLTPERQALFTHILAGEPCRYEHLIFINSEMWASDCQDLERNQTGHNREHGYMAKRCFRSTSLSSSAPLRVLCGGKNGRS